MPSSGGYATARGMAALYQMMANFGTLNGTRIFSRRLVEFVTRNHTGDMHDGGMDMPMHRGLGVHVRGTTEKIRGLGGAHAQTPVLMLTAKGDPMDRIIGLELGAEVGHRGRPPLEDVNSATSRPSFRTSSAKRGSPWDCRS